MSRVYLFIVLYLIGWFVMAMWMAGDKENMRKLSEKMSSDPELAVYPEKVLRTVIFIALIVYTFPWMLHIVVQTVKGILKILIKKPKEKEGD